MTRQELEQLIDCSDGGVDASLLREIASSSDFRFVNDSPVAVDPARELAELRIHFNSVTQAGIQSWGFASVIEKLQAHHQSEVMFIGLKGGGYSAKLYFMAFPEKIIGLVVTRRQTAAPNIDPSGRAL